MRFCKQSHKISLGNLMVEMISPQKFWAFRHQICYKYDILEEMLDKSIYKSSYKLKLHFYPSIFMYFIFFGGIYFQASPNVRIQVHSLPVTIGKKIFADLILPMLGESPGNFQTPHSPADINPPCAPQPPSLFHFRTTVDLTLAALRLHQDSSLLLALKVK